MFYIGKYHKLKVLDKRINWLVLDALELDEAKFSVVDLITSLILVNYVEVLF